LSALLQVTKKIKKKKVDRKPGGKERKKRNEKGRYAKSKNGARGSNVKHEMESIANGERKEKVPDWLRSEKKPSRKTQEKRKRGVARRKENERSPDVKNSGSHGRQV